ncbi:hypothetical protein B0A55_13657, partial [Friedmanniomyces simplex]
MSRADFFLSQLRGHGRITQDEYVANTQFCSLITIYAPANGLQDTAISTVFNTVELIELVLQHLSPAEQLHAQQVCKGFGKVIAASPGIQANTFTRSILNSTPSLPPYTIPGLVISHAQVRGAAGVSATFRFYYNWTYYRK